MSLVKPICSYKKPLDPVNRWHFPMRRVKVKFKLGIAHTITSMATEKVLLRLPFLLEERGRSTIVVYPLRQRRRMPTLLGPVVHHHSERIFHRDASPLSKIFSIKYEYCTDLCLPWIFCISHFSILSFPFKELPKSSNIQFSIIFPQYIT